MAETTAKIVSLTVRPVCVPMQVPHRTASGVVEESPLVLCDVHTDTGVVGHGLVFTYTRAALKPTAEVMANLEPLLVGQPLAPATLELELQKKFRLLGTQGLVGMALAGIDMALWDAKARSCNQSLVELMGGVHKPAPAYGGVGYVGPEESARCAEQWVQQGFKGVKAKIGYPTVEEDLAVVKAMRSAVGDSVSIMVDYNQCLLPQEAIERVRVLDDEGVTWVEEPTLAHDYSGHAKVSVSVGTPIQSGENWWGTLDLQHAIDAEASPYMMLDAMKIGGVSGWMRGAQLTASKGIPVSSHLWPEVSAQLLSLTPTAHWLEYIDWWNPVIQEPLKIVDGMTQTEGVIGAGVEWNEQAVAEFLI